MDCECKDGYYGDGVNVCSSVTDIISTDEDSTPVQLRQKITFSHLVYDDNLTNSIIYEDITIAEAAANSEAINEFVNTVAEVM